MIALVTASAAAAASAFNLSNTLGDGMVLQREQKAVVWGFGTPGTVILASMGSFAVNATVGSDSIWRASLPPTPATTTGETITFTDGTTSLALKNVLFGDVFLCSGQSNMQYTPRSMKGMNNLTAELAAADAYSATMRFFTVGQETNCHATDCSKPFKELAHGPNIRTNNSAPCTPNNACRLTWSPASSALLGGAAWDHFSAVCWLTGRDIHDALGGKVPIGLISSNWGGTSLQRWEPGKGDLYNSMVAPFTVGPMALRGLTWYQGEANVGQSAYYATGFPAMIRGWRHAFGRPTLWFGFVQIAGWAYSHPYGAGRCEQDHSHRAGDLRQAQLAALDLQNVGMTTAIDTGDWVNIHPPDKQNPSRRLAKQALTQIYGQAIAGVDFPLYAGSHMTVSGSSVSVTVDIKGSITHNPVQLTSTAPIAATQSTTLGQGVSVPRNECVDRYLPPAMACDCGWPTLYGSYANGTQVQLNATATIGADGSSIVMTATAPEGVSVYASSYGRASWPMTLFFSTEDGHNPVIPFFANISATDPWTPPASSADAALPAVEKLKRDFEPY